MARSNVRARSVQGGAVLAAAMLCATTACAADAVRIRDAGAGRLVIEAHDATVKQILDALGRSTTVHSQMPDALARHVTGTYAGTLPRVLSRVLAGYDHVIRSTPSGVEVDIVGTAQFAKFTASVANSVTVSAAAHSVPRISGNLDADEENAQRGPAPGPQTVNVAVAPSPNVAAVPPAASAPHPSVPRVSSNLDADEEQPR